MFILAPAEPPLILLTRGILAQDCLNKLTRDQEKMVIRPQI
jgi:hypothetical protein